MIVLTDCPQALGGLGLTGAEPLAVAGLPAGQPELWRALGGRAALWRATAPDPGGEAFWALLLATARAERSQFDVLRELLGDGRLPLPGPVATLALTGDGFHGHHGRTWAAAPGNLHLCAAVRPPEGKGPAAREVLALTALPAVAVVDALRSPALGSLPAGVKWVNDILVDGAKIAGVLAAAQTVAGRVALAVFGIGLNVAVAPDVPPTPFVPAVTSLAGRGVARTAGEAALEVLGSLAQAWRLLERRGQAGVVEAYREAALVVGRRCAVWPEAAPDGGPAEVAPRAGAGEPMAEGYVTGIDDNLGLRVEGRDDPVTHGRLELVDGQQGRRRLAYATYCSARKLTDAGLMPAIARYDSERIREVARRASSEGAVLLILSGRYGLLAAAHEIPWYDHRLAAEEIAALTVQTAARLQAMGVGELVWFTAGADRDPDSEPYTLVMAGACARAGLPLRTLTLPDAED